MSMSMVSTANATADDATTSGTTSGTTSSSSSSSSDVNIYANRLNQGNSDGLIWICKPASLTNRGYGIKLCRGVKDVLKTCKQNMNILAKSTATATATSLVDNTNGASTSEDIAEAESQVDIEEEEAEAEEAKVTNTNLQKAASNKGNQEGWIVQEYIEKPLLISKRKFDIRVFVLLHLDKSKPIKYRKAANGMSIPMPTSASASQSNSLGMDTNTNTNTNTSSSTSSRGELQAYIYEEPYVRTSWKQYSLDDISDRECHLTNDAIQKNAIGYSKFEDGNKLTLEQWQERILIDYPKAKAKINTNSNSKNENVNENVNIKDVVQQVIWPKIKELTAISISAGLKKLETTTINKSFELLGYDYMINGMYMMYMII